ncbi:metal ABC transporter permease [Hugenholtzia roseola]|uniref:metal ABC transporter permease n=1 Tax=Hugenholtzia roseola TaxID=1002 RepID=UPI000554C351|nr:metal ABC transporter permease [Hugenholtzia roseola]
MYDKIVDFLLLTAPNTRYVVLATLLLGLSAAVVGCFTLLQKRSLSGDVVAHAVLPGVCLAFLVTQVKFSLYLIIGASLTGWLSLLLVDYIKNNTKIKEDTALSLVLSGFFGFGVMLLTYIQKTGSAAQAGLEQFLFGKASALIGADVWVFAALSALLILIIFLFYKEFVTIIFNKSFAISLGLPVRLMEFLLTTLTVLAVVLGIQAVGVVLMSALLITPAIAARQWSNRLKIIILIAALIGMFSAWLGALISYLFPQMPTGPWIVLVASICAFGSFLVAPKGILVRLVKQKKHRNRVLLENIVKTLYHIVEEKENKGIAIESILEKRNFNFSKKHLQKILIKLEKQKLLYTKDERYFFTELGLQKGKRLTKLHRLWELYLTERLRIAPDHVHEDAENIEHILTPELEAKLEKLLAYPKQDPHNRNIPY